MPERAQGFGSEDSRLTETFRQILKQILKCRVSRKGGPWPQDKVKLLTPSKHLSLA